MAQGGSQQVWKHAWHGDAGFPRPGVEGMHLQICRLLMFIIY